MTGFDIRIVAMAAMVCDHLAYAFFDDAVLMRLIGRLAFPLFAWGIAKGVLKTEDLCGYLTRLLVLALISQVAYGMFKGAYLAQANVVFTLCIGAMALVAYGKGTSKIIKYGVPVLCALVAQVCNMDYGAVGVAMVFGFYAFADDKRLMVAYQLILAGVWGLFTGHMWVQLVGMMSLVLVCLYNGDEGRKMQKFNYAFYPGHLFGLIGIAGVRLWI